MVHSPPTLIGLPDSSHLLLCLDMSCSRPHLSAYSSFPYLGSAHEVFPPPENLFNSFVQSTSRSSKLSPDPHRPEPGVGGASLPPVRPGCSEALSRLLSLSGPPGSQGLEQAVGGPAGWSPLYIFVGCPHHQTSQEVLGMTSSPVLFPMPGHPASAHRSPWEGPSLPPEPAPPCWRLLLRVLPLPQAPWGKGSGLAEGLTQSCEEAG